MTRDDALIYGLYCGALAFAFLRLRFKDWGD